MYLYLLFPASDSIFREKHQNLPRSIRRRILDIKLRYCVVNVAQPSNPFSLETSRVFRSFYPTKSASVCFSDNNSKEPWRVEDDTDERNEKARKAYQALLTVTARTPDNLEYLNFSREVKSLAQSKYNFTFGNSSVSTFVTAFYDAVLLYALALKESLPKKPGEVNLDGGNLTRRMWGKSFKGKL